MNWEEDAPKSMKTVFYDSLQGMAENFPGYQVFPEILDG